MKQKKATHTLKSEEDVKIHFTIPMLEELGYKRECMSFEETIPVQEGKKKKNIFADIVIYNNKKKETPLIVVDTKAPTEILDRTDKEQVISYARLLPKIAPLSLLTNGSSVQVYQTLDKTRIKSLPNRSELLADFIKAAISANVVKSLQSEARKQLFIVEDVGTFKTLLSRCHNEIRNNEGYEPTKCFDELSKVLFAKMYEEKYNGEQTRFILSTFKDTQERLGLNIVQQIFSDIQKVPEYKSLFSEGTKIELQDRTIEAIVSTFEKYDLTLTRFDVKGEAFEHFLGDTFTGGLGQFFTPRNVVEFIGDAISPKIGEKVIDPFCGTGGFLIYAFEVVSEKIRLHEFAETEKSKWRKKLSDESLYGTDWIERTAQACKMNMIVHGDGNTGVFKHNGFVNIPGIIENEYFDICLTNPPFGATENDPEILSKYELGQGRKTQEREVLALERCIKLVKPDGIVGMVMMDGVLNNDSYHYVRSFLHRETELLAVIGLNEDTFKGYNAEAKTSILLMRRRKSYSKFSEQNVFMAVCENSGYAPNGLPIAGNQLPDILFDYKKYSTSGDTDFIHKHIKIVKIKDENERLDSEYYVSIEERQTTQSPITIANSLFSKIESIQQLTSTIQKNLLLQSKTIEYEWIPISEILQSKSNFVKKIVSKQYRLLGIHGKGEGVFVKSTKSGSEIKAKFLNEVSANWFVYSRLFAANGSFAIIEKEFDKGYMSNEFPTFEVINKKYSAREILEYLVFYLNSPSVLSKINRSRTGSTKKSRGRFKEAQLLKTQIPIPKDQKHFDAMIELMRLTQTFKDALSQLSINSVELPKSLQLKLPTQ
jgi:type I restriction enzyme M protein